MAFVVPGVGVSGGGIRGRKEEVLRRIDVVAEYRKMGVEFTGRRPTPGGWLACRAAGREDRRPSASVHVESGHYHAFGDVPESLSFFDFAVKYGGHADFNDALRHFEGVAGASPPRPPAPPRVPARTKGKVFPTADEAAAWAARPRGLDGWVTDVWVYRDERGTEAFRVVRFESDKGKTYRPFHVAPDEGGWKAGDPKGAGPFPLYRLDRLAANTSATVYVTEGEKCADLVARLGAEATTSAHGASAASRTDWRPLAGRAVVVLPDAGAAGDVYRRDVLARLAALTPRPTVRVVALPGLNDGEDVEQWLDALPDCCDALAALEELAANAPPYDFDGEARPGREDLGLVDLSTVVPRPISWLWERRVARGKLTLVAGEMGIGKSFLTHSLAATVSTGAPWPDLPGDATEPGDVILFGAEDDLEDTVRPRLDAMGADTTRITSVRMGRRADGSPWHFTLEDVDYLKKIHAARPRARLIVIDPVTAYLGRVNDNRNAELRTLLDPLAEFARETGVAVVCVTHFNKSNGPTVLSRVIGSIAYAAVARTVYGVGLDPDDPSRRLFMPVKSNLDTETTSLAYTLVDGVVVWEPEPVRVDPKRVLGVGLDDAPRRPPGPPPKSDSPSITAEAAAWIRRTLADGDLPATTVIALADQAGYSGGTLDKAKALVGARSYRPKGSVPWFWTLPQPRADDGDNDGDGSGGPGACV